MPTETLYLPEEQYQHLNDKVEAQDVDNLSQAVQTLIKEDME
jgi:hypothetical protein